jgi:hypothetical protein
MKCCCAKEAVQRLGPQYLWTATIEGKTVEKAEG